METVPMLNGLWIMLALLSLTAVLLTLHLGERGRLLHPWGCLGMLVVCCVLVWVAPVAGLAALVLANVVLVCAEDVSV